jgi:DNA-binding NtrC family response regulator
MTAKLILIVEDEFLLALEMLATLAEAGYETLGPARTVQEALTLIESSKPDAAFIDCNLNGEPATGVALTLKARRVPFAVVTGYGRDRLPPAFGDGLFAVKPLAPARLLDLVRKLLPDSAPEDPLPAGCAESRARR